jgi:prevent-host-death family protein
MSAREAKNGFGLLIDTARAAPVAIEKHGRPVVVVVSVQEYQRLVNGCGEGESFIPAKPSKKKRSAG